MNKYFSILLLILMTGGVTFSQTEKPVHTPRKLPPLTEVEWLEEHWDFGTITEGEVLKHKFKLKNVGKEDLYILNIRPSCGCTTPEWTEEPTAPGDTLSFEIEFDSKNKSGVTKKTVVVTVNTQKRIKGLTFGGEILKKE